MEEKSKFEFYNGLEWDPNNLTNEMLQFEKETGKNAVYRGKITGQFDFWLNWSNKRKSNNKSLIKEESKTKNTKKKPIKKLKPRVIIKVPPDSICYEKKRRGSKSNPIVETHILNGHEFNYNWTTGQLSIDDIVICPPDSKFGRDMMTYAKQNEPVVSIDHLRNWWIFNYDMAIKKGWDVCANSIEKFLSIFEIPV